MSLVNSAEDYRKTKKIQFEGMKGKGKLSLRIYYLPPQ